MTDLTESEKSDIRAWAWNEARIYGKFVIEEDGKKVFKENSSRQRLLLADELAAWRMSGLLPSTADDAA